MDKLKTFVVLTRPKHWIKNVLIFLPAFFGGRITSIQIFIDLIRGWGIFSFIASAIYIINDINDAERDALHPEKKKRPIAFGKVNKREAWILSIFLICVGIIGIALMEQQNWGFLLIIITVYLFTNVAYSIWRLKNIPVLDILIISFGYILRVIFGAVLTNTMISVWLFVTILTISLFMSAEKRRKELEKSTEYRECLNKYSARYLSMVSLLSLGAGIVFFILWSMEVGMTRGGFSSPILHQPLELLKCWYICLPWKILIQGIRWK